MVCNLVDADLLVILTDIDGLYSADPRLVPEAALIPEVKHLNPNIERLAGHSTHPTGRGGMHSKIQAAKIAGTNGIHTHIANGLHPDVLLRILAGDTIGCTPTSVRRSPLSITVPFGTCWSSSLDRSSRASCGLSDSTTGALGFRSVAISAGSKWSVDVSVMRIRSPGFARE
jgi:hypothetical protein